jgi:adenylosuccinate lyase
MSKSTILAFVDTLDMPEAAKAELKALTPHNYIGNAVEQAKKI